MVGAGKAGCVLSDLVPAPAVPLIINAFLKTSTIYLVEVFFMGYTKRTLPRGWVVGAGKAGCVLSDLVPAPAVPLIINAFLKTSTIYLVEVFFMGYTKWTLPRGWVVGAGKAGCVLSDLVPAPAVLSRPEIAIH
ncbi:hypothetical protein EI546_15940 [Aequorivita sp. H23M31]|uniref:Uncharacterized protein n=1 Tax=Aequorivita ciconiae TaxID=2494375 RepID=A0A410G738_9FLAO|nr:hypothetical protein [Aequorivita sp. H23M31]QAA83108.1 hypothetical protein EI546_15940 [Aequorivita sp. H23M31]